MRKQRQRTAWGTGMNPTGRYAHMFEGKWGKGDLSKTTEKKKQKFLLRIRTKEKILIIFPTQRIHTFS